MDINFTVFATGAGIVNNWLVYRAAETATPTAWVATLNAPPVQVFPKALFIGGVNPVPHIVQIWSSPDGVTLGTLLSDFTYNPSYALVEIRLHLELNVDGGNPNDPLNGSSTFTPIDGTTGIDNIAPWIGEAQWWPEMRSHGGKLKNSEFVINSGNTAFSLTNGDTFGDGDVIFICFPPKITVSNPVFNNLNLFADYKRVTGSAAVDASWYNKYVDLVFAGTSGIIQLPALADVPDNKLLTIFSMNGNQKQVTIKTFGAEIIHWNGLNLNEIYVGKTEEIWLYKRTDNEVEPAVPHWHVAKDLPGMRNVGLSFASDTGLLEAPLQPNCSALDGGSIPIADHPRALWYVNRLPAGQLLTKTARDAGGIELSGFWAIDDGPSPVNLWKPDERGLVERAIPGNRNNDSGRNNASKGGSYDGSHMEQHNHSVGLFTLLLKPSTGVGHETAATFSGGRPPTVPNIQIASAMADKGDRDEVVMKNRGVVRMVWL